MTWLKRILAALLPQSGQTSRRISIGTQGTHGVYVDHDTALTFGAVFAAVKIISESISVLGMHRFNRKKNGGKERMDAHPATRALNRQWNPYMAAQIGREVTTMHALLYGNGYAEIVRDAAGRLSQLWPLLPDRMSPMWVEGELVYRYLLRSGNYVDMEPNRVLHIRGLGFDGVCGYDVVTYMGRSIGHGIAAEQYAGAFFGNGAHLSGALFHPDKLSKDAKESLRQEFNQVYRGSSKAFRMAVFEEGMEWKQFSTTPEAAQMIQTRKFSVTDIARWFRVPPHMLADLEKATFSNIEQQGLEFVVHTLLPWVTRWEQECDLKLVQPSEANIGFHKLNLSSLLRGDLKSRFEAYQVGRQWGWLSANDVRNFEDQDPLPAAIGDVYIIPLNFQRADAMPTKEERQKADNPPPEPPPDNETPPGPGDDQEETPNAPQAAARSVLDGITAKLQRREDRAIRNYWGKPEYWEKASNFFNRHAQVMVEELRPIMGLFAVQLGSKADNPEIDKSLHEIVSDWCDRRQSVWMQAARNNEKPMPTAHAQELSDLLISTFLVYFIGSNER